MGSYKDPSFEDRRSDATKAKKTTLAKFRESPGPDDPLTIKKGRERAAITAARVARAAERDLARQTQVAEVVVQARIAAEAERHLPVGLQPADDDSAVFTAKWRGACR